MQPRLDRFVSLDGTALAGREQEFYWLSILGPPLLLGAIGLAVTVYNLWLLALA